MRRISLLCLFLLILAQPSAAQESTPEATAEALPSLTETYTSNDGAVSFRYPADWEVRERPGNDVVVFVGNIDMPDDERPVIEHRNPGIAIIIWDKVDQFFVEPGYDDTAFGVALFNRIDATNYRPPDDRIIGEVTKLTVGNKRATWFLIQFGFADTLFLAVEAAPNTVSYLALGTGSGETEEWQGTLLAVAASIQLHKIELEPLATESP